MPDWMQTFTGKAFYPLDPNPDDVDIVDIAHALSLICRYGGHASQFYSVAEHCVLLSQAVSPENALWALLHDATEAYVGDMVRPLKNSMPDYRLAEDYLMQIICQKFGLPPEMPHEVHDADTRILINERVVFMGPAPQEWTSLRGLHFLPHTYPQGWNPRVAEIEYMTRFQELTR